MSKSASIEKVENGWIVTTSPILSMTRNVYTSLERALCAVATAVTDWEQFDVGDALKIVKRKEAHDRD